MGHSIKFKPSAERDLDSLPVEQRRRVFKAIRTLSNIPRPSGCKKLKGEDAYRIRVGEYRVIYEIHDNTLVVIVIKIGHRQDVYRYF